MQAKVYRYIRKLMALPFLLHNEIRPIVCVPQHPCRDPAPPQPDWIYPRAVDRQHHLPPKRLKHIQATDPYQQWHWGVAERSEPPSWWQIQIRVLPVDRTPTSRSLPNFYHHQACIRQEVRRSREKYRQLQQKLFDTWDQFQTGNKNASKLLRFCSRLNGPARSQ